MSLYEIRMSDGEDTLSMLILSENMMQAKENGFFTALQSWQSEHGPLDNEVEVYISIAPLLLRLNQLVSLEQAWNGVVETYFINLTTGNFDLADKEIFSNSGGEIPASRKRTRLE